MSRHLARPIPGPAALRRAAVLAAALWTAVPGAGAAQDGSVRDGPVTVGVIDMPPYADTDAAGARTGLAVDLFRLAAEEAGLDWRFVAVPPGGAEAALAAGEARVVLPVIATPDRAEGLHLTQPVHTTDLAVAMPAQYRFLRVAGAFASVEFVRLVLGLSALLLLVGALVWLLERRRNGEQFHRDPVRGLGDGFWWAGVTLTTIGYGDKAPATAAGRAVAMLWMLVGLAVSAALTAAVVNLSDAGPGPLTVAEATEGVRVVAPEHGAADLIAGLRGLDLGLTADAAAALQAVHAGQADVAVGAAPVLRAAAEARSSVRGTGYDAVHVVFALGAGDPLGPTLDRAILTLHASGAAADAARRHLED